MVNLLDADFINMLMISASFSQAIVLGITLFVFYKNLREIRIINQVTQERFAIQSDIEKFTLTLTFADWIKSELSDYLHLLTGDNKDVYMSKQEVQSHFISIADNTIKLINSKIIYRSLLLDEVKKLSVIISSYSSNKKVINSLDMILKSGEM